MSTTLTPTEAATGEPVLAAGDRAALRRFAAWALRRLGAVVSANGDALHVVAPRSATGNGSPRTRPPIAWPDGLAGDTTVHVGAVESADDYLTLSPRSPLADRLVEHLAELAPVVHSAPLVQPRSAGEIAERLLPAYRIDGGRAQLAGCALEDRAFFRIYARSPGPTPEDPLGQAARFVEWTIDADGRRVDDATAAVLRLDDIGPATGTMPGGAPLAAATIDDLTRMAAEAATAASGPLEIVAATLLWCKWAAGKIRVEFPAACTEIRFADWAATLSPPPFVCPQTGRTSFHLAITDDGRIAAAEEVAACAQTGQRMLRRELVECSTSGQLVLAELAEICPITERPVLRRLMAECDQCGQRVGPAALTDRWCAACRRMEAAAESDPRMARVLAEYPALDGWRSWRIAETAKAYVLIGSGLLRRLLVVLDHDSLEPRRVATANRVRRRWTLVPKEQWSLELGQSEGT